MEDASDDETDQISTRTLALARYKRNHELMSDVFRQAAFGEFWTPFSYPRHLFFVAGDKSTAPKSPYSIFDKETLETQTVSAQRVHTL